MHRSLKTNNLLQTMKKKPSKKVVTTTTKGGTGSILTSLLSSGVAGAFLNGFGTNLSGAEGGKTIKKIYKK